VQVVCLDEKYQTSSRTWAVFKTSSRHRAEIAYKTATQEHLVTDGRCLDTGSNDHYHCAGEHSSPAAKVVIGWSSEEYGGDGANVVHGEDKTGA
jgi:hypothetical protein